MKINTKEEWGKGTYPLDKNKRPGHVGIIMDGNGRWANLRGLPRVEGHREGAQRSKDVIKAAIDLGVNALTLYAFSLENWKRPQEEISTLMELLKVYLKTEIEELLERGVVFRVIGNREKLPEAVRMLIEHTEALSSMNTGMTLVLALSYSGKDEIIRAIKRMTEKGYDLSNLDESTLESNLDTAGLPPVDLIIRTSGEERTSNFLIWQAAYAELYFTDTLWPDFTKEEFLSAIHNYQQRERRFGALPESVVLHG